MQNIVLPAPFSKSEGGAFCLRQIQEGVTFINKKGIGRKNNENAGTVNTFRGYYLEDCDCAVCQNYLSRKKGCKLDKCCCEEEKRDALANGRIKRNRGELAWDG
jgi:hypothetical protein